MCKRVLRAGEEPPHALTFRCRTLWESAVKRGTAVPMSVVRGDPGRYLAPGNALLMSRGALPVDNKIAGDGHFSRVESYGGGRIHTVEGNRGDAVTRWEYELADPHLVGVVLYPGGESLDTWQPSDAELDEMIAMAEKAFGERQPV
jgi:hypothetical protein